MVRQGKNIFIHYGHLRSVSASGLEGIPLLGIFGTIGTGLSHYQALPRSHYINMYRNVIFMLTCVARSPNQTLHNVTYRSESDE